MEITEKQILKTERLVLREMSLEDFPAVREIVCDDQTMKAVTIPALLLLLILITLLGCTSSETVQPSVSVSDTPLPLANASFTPASDIAPSASHIENAPKVVAPPEAVVTQWFECFKNKDIDGIEKLLPEYRHGINYDMDHLLGLELLRCEEVKNPNDRRFYYFAEHGYKNAYGKAIVETTFVIEYDDSGNNAGFGPGKSTHFWGFNLVQEIEDSQWRIFDWGY